MSGVRLYLIAQVGKLVTFLEAKDESSALARAKGLGSVLTHLPGKYRAVPGDKRPAHSGVPRHCVIAPASARWFKRRARRLRHCRRRGR